MLKKFLPIFLFLSLAIQTHAANFSLPNVDTSELTGVVKLACEAILCLSSSTRPSECSPSLDHYFGIEKKHWSDTLDARIDFLKQCPVMDSPGMPELTEAIANGAGFCDVAALNKNTLTAYRVYNRQSRTWSAWRDGDYPEEMRRCTGNENSYYYYDDYNDSLCYEAKIVIDNRMPSRCLNYFNHEYTYFEPVQYAGDKYNGGRWIQK